MSFDVAGALKKSTRRAKSDVANKLVSMFLHEISRRACVLGKMSVSDPRYAETVISSFGKTCLYCGKTLELDRATVEHLDGMNRFRIGLHIPGNVAMACKRCNNEKRRDDQRPVLSLAESGWESFLSHDGLHCNTNCKSCAYWASVWPAPIHRQESLLAAKERIRHFQLHYGNFLELSFRARPSIQAKVETLYRDCQNFATAEIEELTSGIELIFTKSEL